MEPISISNSESEAASNWFRPASLPCPEPGGGAQELKQRITELTMNNPFRYRKAAPGALLFLIAASGVRMQEPAACGERLREELAKQAEALQEPS